MTRLILTSALTALLWIPSNAAESLVVSGAKCEWQVRPLGIDVPAPSLSWTLDSSRRGDSQSAYQIIVASDPALLPAGKPDLWDSGKVLSNQSIGIGYSGKPLASGQRVWWQVRVWDSAGKAGPYGEPQWWEMGLLSPADWSGKWISDGRPQPTKDEDFYKPAPAPLLRKAFTVKSPVKRARVYVSGLGYHELSINGGKVGDHQLEPGWTVYGKRVPYGVHDVTSLLKPGDNAVGMMLGNGWFNPLPLRFWGQRNFRQSLTVGRPRAMLRMDIDYADGTRERIVTDESWRTAAGPLQHDNIYLGEVYDARLEIPGWDTPGFDDSKWRSVAVETESLGELKAQTDEPIRFTGEFQAKKLASPEAGPFIFDFGQNFTGVVRYRFNAPAGTKYVMRYGELLAPDGSLNPMTSVAGQIKGKRQNADGTEHSVGGPGAPDIAWQGDTYITKGGGEEIYTPRFTFHAFRYVEISALPLGLTGLRLHSDVRTAGTFSCSNENFNRIQEMCRHTFVSNLIGVQSDCPHRERLAYGGDIVATSEALLMNYDMHGFYRKTARDFADDARPDGNFTDTAPFVGINYCGVGWAMAHPLLLEQLYQHYGNKSLIEEQLPAAIRWFDLEASKRENGLVVKGLGDHEALKKIAGPVITTPMFIDTGNRMARLSRIIGNQTDALRFDLMAGASANAWAAPFNNRDEMTGTVGGGSQSEQVLALGFGVVPEHARKAVFDHLVASLTAPEDGPSLTTGIFGTRFLLDQLSRNGRHDLAYALADRKTFPSWGWMLENGATTLWETWKQSDNTFSHNHPMFGSVSQWFFNWLGGIRPANDAVGFDKILIAPQAAGDLKWVKAEYQSIRGLVASHWTRENGKFDLKLTIPTGASATVFIPAKDAAAVTENAKPVAQADGVKFLRMEGGAAVFAVGSGRYHFVSQ